MTKLGDSIDRVASSDGVATIRNEIVIMDDDGNPIPIGQEGRNLLPGRADYARLSRRPEDRLDSQVCDGDDVGLGHFVLLRHHGARPVGEP
jgi:non-ribosomal peptide synthetase component E (peptide arylation enzyme)